MKETGKRYSDEFKCEAVRLVKKEGYSIQKAVKNLGIAHGTLSKWVKTSEAAGDAEFPGNPFEMQIEIRQFR